MLAAGTQASRKILATRAPPACSHLPQNNPQCAPHSASLSAAGQILLHNSDVPFSACYYYAYSTVVQPHISQVGDAPAITCASRGKADL